MRPVGLGMQASWRAIFSGVARSRSGAPTLSFGGWEDRCPRGHVGRFFVGKPRPLGLEDKTGLTTSSASRVPKAGLAPSSGRCVWLSAALGDADVSACDGSPRPRGMSGRSGRRVPTSAWLRGQSRASHRAGIFFSFFFFFETEFRSCYPGWSATARSWLTATSASWVQAILLLRPPE